MFRICWLKSKTINFSQSKNWWNSHIICKKTKPACKKNNIPQTVIKVKLNQSRISLNLRTGPTGHATLFNQWEGALVFINKQMKTLPQWSNGGAKVQVTGHRSGHRLQATGHRSGHRSGYRPPVTGHRSQVTQKTIGHWTKLFWTDVLLYKNKISQGTLMIFLSFNNIKFHTWNNIFMLIIRHIQTS